MPLDHYVSQVHLRNFHSPELGEMLHAIRKQDMKAFRCRSKDVCRIEGGSTNDYLPETRAIEGFLKTVEPKYNGALQALRADKIDADTVYVIAGFVAYVLTCSPAAMRINSVPLREALQATAAMLDRSENISMTPPGLQGRNLSDLLANGTVVLDVDEKYSQAIGIGNVMRHVNNFGNCHWDILINEEPESPFFTSDYPIAIEQSAHPRIINRLVPLAPDIAIRICPCLDRKRSDDFTFPSFGSKRRKIALAEIRDLNRLIVRSAESLVFFRDDHNWVARFIERHKHYRVESAVRRIPTAKRELVWTRLELREQRLSERPIARAQEDDHGESGDDRISLRPDR